jgi:hypothetical protein
MAYSIVVSRNLRRLESDERGAYRQALRVLAQAGEIVDFGVLYFIEQISDSSGQVKVGVTSQTGLPNRASVNQTGSPYEQRVVTLCVFQSRDVAAIVERHLKAKHREARSQGGTEWIGLSRHDLAADVSAIAYELHINQMLMNADPKRVAAIYPDTTHHFYGVILLDIVEGEICRYRESEISASPVVSREFINWDQLRNFLERVSKAAFGLRRR